MMWTLRAILFAMLAVLPFSGQTQPAQPLTLLSWVNPTTNVDGSALDDLATIEVQCGTVTVSVPASEAGAAMTEALPTGLPDGLVSCFAWATDTSGNAGPASNTIEFACGGGDCFPLGLPSAPRLSAQ